jgi:hypothetical protein
LDLCGGWPDEACEGQDFSAWDAEAVADEVVERQFQFHAGFGQPQHDVTRVAAFFADSSTGNFSFGDEGADVVFGSVGVDRNFRAFENTKSPTPASTTVRNWTMCSIPTTGCWCSAVADSAEGATS